MKNSDAGKPLRFFSAYVKKCSIFIWIYRLLLIPVGIFVADMTAKLVSEATNGDMQNVVKSGLSVLVFVMAVMIFRTVVDIFLEKAKYKALQKCKEKLYTSFLSLPQSVLYAVENGNAKENLTDDFDELARKYLSYYPDLYMGLVEFAVYFLYIANKNFYIALCIFGLSLFQLVSPMILKKTLKNIYGKMRDLDADLTELTVEARRAFAEIKLYDLHDRYIEKVKRYHTSYLHVGVRQITAHSMKKGLENFAAEGLRYVACAVIGVFALYGKVNLAVAMSVVALTGNFFSAVKCAGSTIPSFAIAKKATERLDKLFCTAKKGKKVENTVMALADATLTLGNKTVFSHVSIQMPDGICLIKGENGAGKSTLLKLLSGLLTADRGNATFGTVPAGDVAESVFPDTLFYVPQEDAAFRFSAEILFQMVCSGEKTEKAFAVADALGLTGKQLYTVPIANLSGGERKKVYLALAFAVDPAVLLLDEPSNYLDTDGKEKLLSLLKEREKTTYVVTHDDAFDMLHATVLTVGEGGIHGDR